LIEVSPPLLALFINSLNIFFTISEFFRHFRYFIRDGAGVPGPVMLSVSLLLSSNPKIAWTFSIKAPSWHMLRSLRWIDKRLAALAASSHIISTCSRVMPKIPERFK